MPVLAVVPTASSVSTVFVVAFEDFLHWRYGATGVIALLLLTIGIKARRPAVSSTGAVVLALLVARPAL
ncbi:hypothetical protein AB0G32_00345 [Streptomyces sp. NPDC023723]|uniref:hypothetical protein n=1 Tax=Streptomyces sp. NPDC023723 TaxID=3154323 RepID=UPI0033ED413B